MKMSVIVMIKRFKTKDENFLIENINPLQIGIDLLAWTPGWALVSPAQHPQRVLFQSNGASDNISKLLAISLTH